LRGFGNVSAGCSDEAGLAGSGFAGVRDVGAVAEKAIEHRLVLKGRKSLPFEVNVRHELTVQNVVPGAFRDGRNLGDEGRGDAEFGEALAEEFDDGIEVGVVQTAGDEGLVAAAHVGAAVVVGAAERHGEEGLLFTDLAVHIDAVKEVADAVVRQNLAIEKVDGGVDCGLTAKLLIEIVLLRRKGSAHKLCIYDA
jgi:hypothetical protein